MISGVTTAAFFLGSAVELICRMVIPGSHPANRANVTTNRERARVSSRISATLVQDCLSDAQLLQCRHVSRRWCSGSYPGPAMGGNPHGGCPSLVELRFRITA